MLSKRLKKYLIKHATNHNRSAVTCYNCRLYDASHLDPSQQTFVLMKTSFVFVFERRLQDVLIKTNMFASALRLQKTSSRRLQDVLVKTNIFVLAIRLQDVFRTFSRRLQDVLQKGLQDISKTSSRRFEDVFKTSSRSLEKRLQDVSSS